MYTFTVEFADLGADAWSFLQEFDPAEAMPSAFAVARAKVKALNAADRFARANRGASLKVRVRHGDEIVTEFNV